MRRRELMWAGGGVMLMPRGVHAQVADLNDAINKAGRQRMLSQRMAKSYLALGQGVEPGPAERTLAASMALFDRQLAELRAYAPQPDIKATYVQLETAWSGYKAALVGEKPARPNADSVLALSGQVLKLANDGTGQLEKVSTRPLGRLVNIAGRQRMLSQRMAAYYFGICWGVQVNAGRAAMKTAREEFIAAHALLKSAPEATPAIRAELDLAEMQWTFFDTALRAAGDGGPTPQAMSNVFTASERILQVMDGVTGMYSRLG